VLAVVASGDTVYAACQDGHVKVLDLETKTLVRTIIVEEVRVYFKKCAHVIEPAVPVCRYPFDVNAGFRSLHLFFKWVDKGKSSVILLFLSNINSTTDSVGPDRLIALLLGKHTMALSSHL
jgi:hypothetical protein